MGLVGNDKTINCNAEVTTHKGRGGACAEVIKRLDTLLEYAGVIAI